MPTRDNSVIPPLVPYLTTSLTLETADSESGIDLAVGVESSQFYFIAEGLNSSTGNIVVLTDPNLQVYNPETLSWVSFPDTITIPFEQGRLLTPKTYKIKLTYDSGIINLSASGGGLQYSQLII